MPGIGSIFFDVSIGVSFLIGARIAFVKRKVSPFVLIAVAIFCSVCLIIIDVLQKRDFPNATSAAIIYMCLAIPEVAAIIMPSITVKGEFPVVVVYSFIISLVSTTLASFMVLPFEDASAVLGAEMTAQNGKGWAYAYVCATQIIAVMIVARLLRPIVRRKYKKLKIVWGVVFVMLFLEVTGAAMKAYSNYKALHESDTTGRNIALPIVFSYLMITLILIVAGGVLMNLAKYMDAKSRKKSIDKNSLLEGRIMSELEEREDDEAVAGGLQSALAGLKSSVEALGGVLEQMGFERLQLSSGSDIAGHVSPAIDDIRRVTTELGNRVKYVSLRARTLDDTVILLCDLGIEATSTSEESKGLRERISSALVGSSRVWKVSEDEAESETENDAINKGRSSMLLTIVIPVDD
ncbi:MAG: hypothetical protein IKO61_08130 [Lachnospiraceae bacterium]|nr:hypothetical protein [Lachnospiraceae bacterium]